MSDGWTISARSPRRDATGPLRPASVNAISRTALDSFSLVRKFLDNTSMTAHRGQLGS